MLKDKSLVFISDKPIENKKFSIMRKDGEGNSMQALYDMEHVLSELSDHVYIYTDLKKFEREIVTLDNPIVLSSFYGEANPSSKSIVPIICDNNNIPYAGASAYAHMICNDKYLSKKYIEHFNLKTAKSVIIYNPKNEFELKELSCLEYPVVIKPNFGGGSNGIDSSNVKKNIKDTIEFVEKLYSYQELPILVEEYLQGYEISLVITGNQNKIDLIQEVQIIINNKEYFTEEIFGLESKKMKIQPKSFKPSNLINKNDIENMCTLFKSFNKMEFMRIDCRVKDGVTHIIELSPDCYLGLNGAFYEGFKINDISFKRMIKTLLENALLHQYSSSR